MNIARRKLAGLIAIALTLAATGAYLALQAAPVSAGNVDPQRKGTLLWVQDGVVHQNSLTNLDHRGSAGPACQRVHAAAGTLICLRAGAAGFVSEILVYDGTMKQRLSLSEWGLPSRARVSPSGNLVAWTVFRTGDSYLMAGSFATTAGIYNLVTGAHYGSLEDFAVTLDGQPYSSLDINFWGVTFSSDDNTFYATMSSRGRIWLVKGDLAARRVQTVREGIECPSLSPDETRIAYKKRTGDQWRVHVLDLATGADAATADPSHVDDQPAWLDPATVAYSREFNGKPAVFAVPANGTGTPRLVLAGASSPVVIS